MSNWAYKEHWPQADTVTLKASSQVTAAGITTPLYVGKGKYQAKLNVTANANATGEFLRVEVQGNRKLTEDNEVQSTVVYDIDFEASNSITFVVDGDAITPVVYATSHDLTIAAVVTAINLLDGVTAVLAVTDTDSRTIIVTKDDLNEEIGVVASVVTLGTNQAVATITYQEDWYTLAQWIFDAAVDGSVNSGVDDYFFLFENPCDNELRIEHTIYSTPDVTYSAVLRPLETRA